MKAVFIFLLTAISLQSSYAQNIIPSDCNAPDSIKTLYEDDAAMLANEWAQDNNHISKNNIRISDSVSGIFMKALIAVYNAENMPARDTVVRKFNIHSSCKFFLHEFLVSADSNVSWMKQLRIGAIPTGNHYLDSVINDLNLSLKSYWSPKHWKEDRALFYSKTPYNMLSLSNIMEKLDSIDYAAPNNCIGDGNDITATITSTYTELIYNYGWGDCPAGCIYERFWKFRVYKDCSVEFIESYGDKYRNVGLQETPFINVNIFPNPFQNTLTLSGINSPFQYSISNILGKTLITGQAENNTVKNLETLEKGIYILQIQSGEKTGTYKLLKN